MSDSDDGVRLQRTMLAERIYRPFPHGEPFGQYEDITTRIKNILDEYDGGSDVINEMIQNADDAGATEIRFILDQRQLPTDGELLSDTWAELQGPALIVYNNRPFEDIDLKCIQSLGMGSKRANPEMTGNFGIGFNTVYRLTDVPMFISNGEILCVLDPHRLYVPIATEEAPGGIFDLDPDFKAMFSNVLKGFHPTNDLKTKQSTIFRLPLRTKTQVASSKIGNKEITTKEVLDMLHTFEARAEDSLFFLKNIEKIHLTYEDEQRKWQNSTFSANLSDKDKKKKIKFFQDVAKNEPLDSDLMVVYKTTIRARRWQHSEWLILQRLSCMKNNVQENLSQLRERKELIASPLVGIAVQLQGKNKECRTYTTLPLPGYNILPVHINGKFMLDQGRKQCYLHDDDSYKSQWNRYLIRYVLAPLYIQALEYLKDKFIEDWDESFKGDKAEAVQTQNCLLKLFQAHLPPTRNTENLEKLLLHQVYVLLFRDKLKLVCSVVLNTRFQQELLWLSVPDGIINNLKEEPETILKVLYDVAKHDLEQANFCIGRDDRLALLNYLLEHQSHLIKSDEKHVKMMKFLPLFETLNGKFVSLMSGGPTYTYVMCNEPIEKQDLRKLKDLKQVVVLGMKLVEYQDLCKTLDILLLNGTDLYKRYIIPCMSDFSLEAIIRHMNWVMCNLTATNDAGLRNALGSARLITTCSGERKALTGLYSRNIKDKFGNLLPDDQFIPQTFWQTLKVLFGKSFMEYGWRLFLINLGLKNNLSQQDFFELAEKLQSKEGSISHEKLKEISQQLVYYLKDEIEWHKDNTFLNKVSKIKFVLAHSVTKDLMNALHQQDSVFKGLICYHDSVPEREEKICWTVKKLLPSWATFYSSSRKNILKALGIRETPEVEDVVTHLTKVCFRLQSRKNRQETTDGLNSKVAIASLRKVQEATFTFFGTHLEKLRQHIELLERAKKIPCVLVEEGKKLVCPNQVVTENFIECPPFLYILPADSQYGFIKVLKTLGTENKITHTHYILALNMFHDKYGDQQIVNPNFKKTLQHVYLGFLSQIMQVGPEKVTEETLYLPDEDSRMQKSTDIFIFLGSQHPNIAALGKLWNTLIVEEKLPLNKCSDALMHLPNIIRPLSLKEFVSQTFCEESPCCKEDFHSIAYDIGRIFHSELFARVITQLINAHDLHTKKAPAKQDELSALFSAVVVKCYKEVKIQMFENGTNNPMGEKTVAMFLKKTGENDEVNIMVAHDQSEIKDVFIEILVSLIKPICPFKSQKEVFTFAMMLQDLDVSKQTESLNEIRKKCLNEENCDETYLPQVGDVVPEDVAALLDQNPLNYYNEFDFVACEVQSENAGAAAEGNKPESMYIYGQIVKEVENADDSEGILKWYQVKLSPGEPVEKSSLDIYKFLPMKELRAGIVNSTDLACLEDDIDGNDANGSNKFSHTEQETMDEISDQLESFWRLPPDDRRRAIKRLYLYWHPDKNPPEQKVFCEHMFVHIKQEIDRLEKGLPRKSKKSDPDSKGFCSSWNSDFNNWNRQARNDNRRRKNYNKRAGKSGGFFASSMRSSGIPPSFATSCHPAAKLWCLQAKHDLDAAIHQAGSAEPLYEWIYYQYYEVARKSLNAMILTRSPRVSQSANLKELLLDVLESFGHDPGDVHNTVQLLLKNQVDDILPLKPIGGKTPHQNYQPYDKCCKEVGDAAMKLLKLAEDLIAKTNRSD